MKKSVFKMIKFLAACLLFAFVCVFSASAYMVKYKEDWYRLYHVHYQQYPDDCIENIYWLEKAAQADFANPLYANAKIDTEKQWEKYRYLFQMHINLKLIEQHLRLGRTFDKKVAKFYDAPWKDEYIRNLEKALSFYNAGLYYWQEAQFGQKRQTRKTLIFFFLQTCRIGKMNANGLKPASLTTEKC